jgi:hypothetical protein
MAYDKLVLHPQDPRAILQDPAHLLDALRSRGLIGGPLVWNGESHYAPGARFEELIQFRFKGFAKPEARELHVSLSETAEDPEFLGGSNAQTPHCPECRGIVSDWKVQLRTWRRDHRGTWDCARCGRGVEVENLDWAHTGGIARYSVDLWGIPPAVAVPSVELLAFLQRTTLQEWSYFYYRLGTDSTRSVRSRVQPW